ncbi:DeoR/GlpR family transcriptional regulator [Streptomyces sp. 7-21]|nr:DeoR/GlpR family transcriptional regulator [Streptomyces sp. 7-21]
MKPESIGPLRPANETDRSERGAVGSRAAEAEGVAVFARERQERIVREVRERGSVRLAELAEQLGVSMVTLRRDVEVLAGQGLVRRVHGGITRSEPAPSPAPGPAPAPGGQQLVIGMVVPTASYYYPAVIKGAREQAERHGARIVLAVSRYDDEEARARVDQLAGSGVDGLLLTPSRQPDARHEDWLTTLPRPAVMVERQTGLGRLSSRLDSVASHHAHGAFLAARHLADLGHRRLVTAARPSPTTQSVRQGFLAAVRELGLAEPVQVDIGADGPADEQCAQVLAAVADGATGMLVHNDSDALVLVQQLQAAGVRLPEDLSLVAYDDEVAALSAPPLTAVAPPKEAVGRRAVDLLVRRLTDDPDAPAEHTVLLPELKRRASTAPAR